MAIAIANTSAVHTNEIFEAGTGALNFGFTPTQGNRMFALVGNHDGNETVGGTDISSIATTNFTWAVISSAKVNFGTNSRNLCTIWTATVPASPGTTGTITFNTTVANYYNAIFVEVSGLHASPVDQVKTGTAAGSTTSLAITADGANAQADELVLAALQSDHFSASAGAAVAATGYTTLGSHNSTLAPAFNGSRKIVSAGETSSATWSSLSSSNNGLLGVLVTLKAASTQVNAPRARYQWMMTNS